MPLTRGLASLEPRPEDLLTAAARRRVLIRALHWFADQGEQERQIANLILAIHARGFGHNEAAIVAGVWPESSADLEQAGLNQLRQIIEAMGHRSEHLL